MLKKRLPPSAGTAEQLIRCLRRTTTMSAACALFTQENPYAFLECISDNELIFGYHACVCSCVKQVDGAVPRLWCGCSVGYAEAMFRQVFDQEVQAELPSSVKAGDDRCAIRVRIP